jgi:DNA-binding CsgD family transcriptional regulator
MTTAASQQIDALLKRVQSKKFYNPYHDARGRFAAKPGGGAAKLPKSKKGTKSREIQDLFAKGAKPSEIAKKLGVTPQTVHQSVKHLKGKVGAAPTDQLTGMQTAAGGVRPSRLIKAVKDNPEYDNMSAPSTVDPTARVPANKVGAVNKSLMKGDTWLDIVKKHGVDESAAWNHIASIKSSTKPGTTAKSSPAVKPARPAKTSQPSDDDIIAQMKPHHQSLAKGNYGQIPAGKVYPGAVAISASKVNGVNEMIAQGKQPWQIAAKHGISQASVAQHISNIKDILPEIKAAAAKKLQDQTAASTPSPKSTTPAAKPALGAHSSVADLIAGGKTVGEIAKLKGMKYQSVYQVAKKLGGSTGKGAIGGSTATPTTTPVTPSVKSAASTPDAVAKSMKPTGVHGSSEYAKQMSILDAVHVNYPANNLLGASSATHLLQSMVSMQTGKSAGLVGTGALALTQKKLIDQFDDQVKNLGAKDLAFVVSEASKPNWHAPDIAAKIGKHPGDIMAVLTAASDMHKSVQAGTTSAVTPTAPKPTSKHPMNQKAEEAAAEIHSLGISPKVFYKLHETGFKANVALPKKTPVITDEDKKKILQAFEKSSTGYKINVTSIATSAGVTPAQVKAYLIPLQQSIKLPPDSPHAGAMPGSGKPITTVDKHPHVSQKDHDDMVADMTNNPQKQAWAHAANAAGEKKGYHSFAAMPAMNQAIVNLHNQGKSVPEIIQHLSSNNRYAAKTLDTHISKVLNEQGLSPKLTAPNTAPHPLAGGVVTPTTPASVQRHFGNLNSDAKTKIGGMYNLFDSPGATGLSSAQKQALVTELNKGATTSLTKLAAAVGADKSSVGNFVHALKTELEKPKPGGAMGHALFDPSLSGRLQSAISAPVPPSTTHVDVNQSKASKDAFTSYYKQYLNTLPHDEKSVVQKYTGSWYATANSALRKEARMTPKLKEDIEALDRALDKGSAPHDLTVVRGLGSFQYDVSPGKLWPGKVLTDKGFASTSVNVGGGFGGQKLVIRVPKGAKGLFVRPLSHYAGEDEFLLPRNSKFKVISVSPKQKTYGYDVITVELVP